MDSRSSTMQLPRLDDANFEFWRQSVRLIANATKIMKHIEADTDPSKLANDEERKAVYLLANTMLLSMNDKTRRIATGAGNDADLTPFNMLSRLESHYLPNTTANDIQLRRQLYTMKWSSGTSMEYFANEIRALANRINTAEKMRIARKGGNPSFIGDRDMVAVLVMSLPNDFDTEVTLIERESDTTFEKAVETLRTREQRLKISAGESSSANSIQNGRKYPPCDTCGKNGHSAARCFKNGYRRGGNRSGRGGRGRGRQKEEARASEITDEDQDVEFPVMFLPVERDENDEEYTIENLFRREELVLVTPQSDRLGVIIDSGCSRHVCGAAFKEYLHDWRDGPEITVRVADGNPHTSRRYGTFRARVETANGVKPITIRNVLYVEAIRSMLVSVSMLCNNGYSVDFRGNRCTLHDPQGQTIEVMKKVGENLFRLPLTSIHSQKTSEPPDTINDKYSVLPNMEDNGAVAMFAKSTSENIRAWHNSLGHPGINMMTSLSMGGKIPKFSKADIADVISRCECCNMAKARAWPAPENTGNRATKVMERIHCDAVTKLPATASGKTGFSLIVDEYSKFIDVRLISQKNETQDHIKDFVARMAAAGHKVSKLRTDSAAEFVKDAEFKKWLVNNKIVQEASAPYAKHQNGVVERHIQTIEDRTTAILTQSGLGVKFWGEAIHCAVATWNATTNRKKSPLEAVSGRAGNLAFLKPFGCRVYIRTDGSLQKHMEPRAEMGIFLGYSSETKGYKVARDPQWRSIVIRAPRDCVFKEDEFPAKERKTNSNGDTDHHTSGTPK